MQRTRPIVAADVQRKELAMLRGYAVAVVLSLALIGGIAGAAEEAVPTVSPAAGACDSPPLPLNTAAPTEPTAASNDAPTNADSEGTGLSSGIPADAAPLELVRAAEENLAACVNAREWLAVAALLTPRYMQAVFGTSNPQDMPARLEGLGLLAFKIREVSDARTHADGRLSAEVVWVLNSEPRRKRDYFIDREGYLLLDEEDALPLGPPAEDCAPFPAHAVLLAGDDEFVSGSCDDYLEGNQGNDRLSGGAGDDVINGVTDESPGSTDLIDCGAGDDVVFANEDDQVANCEDVRRFPNPEDVDSVPAPQEPKPTGAINITKSVNAGFSAA
jgi:hypothetical protein